MAFDQTLLSSISNTSFSFLKNPFSNTKNPTLLSVNFVSSYPKPNTKRLPFSRNLKGSVNYRDNQVVEYPKPAEIPWNKEICNSVHLIGIVGAPVEIKHLPSGKAVAWTRIGVRKSAAETSWINLTFWDELAEVAARHLEKGNQIYVSGRLIADTVETEDGKLQTYYKVVVQQLNLVERNYPSSSTMYDRDSDNITGGRKFGNGAPTDKGNTEELWQAFFTSPLEWWDNRKNKRNPKYPDFKHKDTGEALWIEGRYNPSWVKSQLAVLDERMGSRYDQEQEGMMHLSPLGGENFMSF